MANKTADFDPLVEPGYLDDRDRDCLRFLVTVKGTTGELRLPVSEVKTLAKQLLEQAIGHAVRLTIRKDAAR